MSESDNFNVPPRNLPTREELVKRFEEAKKKHEEAYNQAIEKIKKKSNGIISGLAEKDLNQ